MLQEKWVRKFPFYYPIEEYIERNRETCVWWHEKNKGILQMKRDEFERKSNLNFIGKLKKALFDVRNGK